MFLLQKTQSNGQAVNVAVQDANLPGTVLKLKKAKVMFGIFIHFPQEIKPRW